jgi:PAS domain S-box-containing protein
VAVYEILYDDEGKPCDWRILGVNPAYLQFSGRTRQEITGRKITEIYGIERPPEQFLSSFAKVVATGEPAVVEGFFDPLGKHLFISVFALGGPRFAALITDVTERRKIAEALRQSEDLYRSLFENMLNGFAYCKMLFENGQPMDFVYLNVNRTFESITGLTNVVGKRVSEIFPGIREKDPEMFEIYGRVALGGKPEKFEIYLKTLDRWFAATAYSPEKEYFVAIFNDITSRKQAAEALRLSEENLRYLATQLLNAQERERLRIAHELHDDLGQSLLLLKLQLSGFIRDLPPAPAAFRQAFLNALDSTQDIIDSLRCLSHDLVPPALTEVGLKAALHDLIEEFYRHHPTITGAINIDEAGPPLSPDAALIIYRIMQESLTNISKYSRATEVSVSLLAKEGQLWLTVADNGTGFAVEEVSARPGRKRGLGLTSMEERARMLGGSFHLESQPGRGTRIEIRVPFQKELKGPRLTP